MFAVRLLSALLLVALPIPGRLGAAEPATRVVHVSGEGLVRVVPDQVVVGMTIRTVDDDLVQVRADSDKQARSVLDLAKRHGVAESGFEVSRLELSLHYNEQLRRQIYEVERDVTVTLHQLNKLDALVSDLLAVPDSKITAITFSATKAREHRLDALRRAVADAQQKANLLADLNQLALGKARDISVNMESQSPFVISVVPVVGAADQRTRDQGAERILGARPRRAKHGRAKRGLPAQFVTFQAVKQRPAQGAEEEAAAAAEAEEPEQGAPFAMGLLEVTASVSIDFELVAR